ncbi:hypothetical protein DKP76_18165 [Falsochrobactrum shanghaiense]|uniref:DNA methylase N-4/N-6 domain-containing protein n=2 Tax=Falsochrobactrum shanghaiense TaxID=2201899 RepID=A0A316J4P8_9HYPH|nr:DNA adenine methylase [Falsochrobactrum shanghaiense]PWL16311.1 hypothetical protein DKP76_18165 [Falsochrobactrum shanghaiense]
MGSKSRLLPWIFDTLNELDFESVLDPFSGTGCVGYLFKSMDRRVVAEVVREIWTAEISGISA